MSATLLRIIHFTSLLATVASISVGEWATAATFMAMACYASGEERRYDR